MKGEDVRKTDGDQYFPSRERMQEIEEVYRKMGLETEEKRREMREQGYVCEEEKQPDKCWVTSLSDSSNLDEFEKHNAQLESSP